MVHASLRNLQKAFQRQRPPGLLPTQSQNLLLFYAVECGLKAAFLKRNRLSDTSAMEAELKEKGHDLAFWAKKLYLPAIIAGANLNFRLRAGTGRLGVGFAHQAWRYGQDIEREDEIVIEEWLKKVSQWAKEELS